MATGEKLPNTNLNLIQDTDMIDHADINAIAQAVEANATDVNALYPTRSLPNGTDLHTAGKGVYILGGTGQFVNGPGGALYGVLEVIVASERKFLRFHNHNNTIHVKAYSGTAWTSWTEVTPIPVETRLTADKFRGDYIRVLRTGGLCVTSGYFILTEAIPTGEYYTIGSVPGGFRPVGTVTTWSVSPDASGVVQLNINKSGAIAVYSHGSSPLPIGTRLTANLTWFTNG